MREGRARTSRQDEEVYWEGEYEQGTMIYSHYFRLNKKYL